ncbi:MAG: dihydroorotase, partial [Acidimicrobiia bacterium]|nr:dihydroorotase [Acidimicrobiia bacterium]
MFDLVLRNGSVLTPEGTANADVGISSGSITAIESGLDATAADTIDCTGCWVGPGLVDLHSHLREPGEEWKEDIASGSRAAAAGGYTA